MDNKWEKTGLLEGLTSNYDRICMSCILDDISNEMLKLQEGKQRDRATGVALPIAVRIYHRDKNLIMNTDIQLFCEDIYNKYKIPSKPSIIDVEANWCSSYANNFKG